MARSLGTSLKGKPAVYLRKNFPYRYVGASTGHYMEFSLWDKLEKFCWDITQEYVYIKLVCYLFLQKETKPVYITSL